MCHEKHRSWTCEKRNRKAIFKKNMNRLYVSYFPELSTVYQVVSKFEEPIVTESCFVELQICL